MNRKQRRKAMKEAKSSGSEEMESKVALFGKMPDECLTCQKPFDKLDKEMVLSWNVVVREQDEIVRLYCPECWDKAREILEDFTKRLEGRVETST
tara:strand:- start:128 stop:412 length:285 start_codon:yes stop_codon:yes gene_type:complete